MKFEVKDLEFCLIAKIYNVKFNTTKTHVSWSKEIQEEGYIFITKKYNSCVIPDEYNGITTGLTLNRLDQSINRSLKDGYYITQTTPLGFFYKKQEISLKNLKKLEKMINSKVKDRLTILEQKEKENLDKLKESLNNRFE